MTHEITGVRGNPLEPGDYVVLEARWIDPPTANQALLRRVDSRSAAEILGKNGTGRWEGIAIPYVWPGEKHVRDFRVRRDHPEIENGKPKQKYASPPGRGNMLYFPPDTNPAWLSDTTIPLVLTEGEFKTLALGRAASRDRERFARPAFLAAGLSGAWNWRGSIGKTTDANGARVDVKGVIPDLFRLDFVGRETIILFDSDVESNESIRAARSALTKELCKRGAVVRWFAFPEPTPAGVKGIDDLLAAIGPERALALIASAKLASPEFPLTDIGNAERFVALNGRQVRFCHPWGKWLVWDGRRWAIDRTAEIVRRAKATTRKMLTDAFQIEDPDKRSRLLGHASSSEKATRVKAMIELATAEEGVPVTPQDLDADPCLLNVLNGTVDLRTGTLYEHRRSDLITKIAPVVYDPRAMCPTWLAFQQRIMGGNEELIAFKQRAVGYALTGLVTEKRSLFFYYGTGNNGKTTELELLRDMLGDYAGQLRIESLMEQRSRDGNAPSPDIADLRGLRFVISSEPSEGQRLAEATIKYLTGMGTIKARHLHKENFEFKQTWKFFMDCNHKPVIRGTDRAIWNRIGLVPFDIVISDEEIDKELPAKLREELPGILAWAVEGCLAWQASGLEVPAQIRRATEGYRAEMDVIGRFVEERCVMMSSLACRGKELYKNYTQWCVESGEPPLTLTSFGLRMAEKGFRKKHDEKGVKYEGLGIAFQGTDDADQS